MESLKLKQNFLLAGDIAALYLSLILTLLVRYPVVNRKILFLHLWPLTVIFLFWIIIFSIAGLYELRFLKNNVEFNKKFWSTIAICGLFSVLLFYFVPAFVITPKTNLFIFLLFFSAIGYLWRSFYNSFLQSSSPPNKILLIGYNQISQEVADHISRNPQLGYEVKFWMKEGLQDKELNHLAQIILAGKINTVVIPAHIKKNSKAAKLIYQNLVLGIEVVDLADLYEIVFQKIPLAELEEVWFLENLARRHRVYEILKRPAEIIFAIVCGTLTFPLAILVAALIKLTSRGPIIYKQNRAGKNGTEFIIYKFRTMRLDAEQNSPQRADMDYKQNVPKRQRM